MKSLQSFECRNCPQLLSPPPEIAEQGGESVMYFIREVCMNGEINTEMLLFLIGDGEVFPVAILHHSFDQPKRIYILA